MLHETCATFAQGDGSWAGDNQTKRSTGGKLAGMVPIAGEYWPI
jgi:hypothetical protein